MSIDVKRLAEQAGLRDYCAGYGDENAFLQAFANLVLEEAAKICEKPHYQGEGFSALVSATCAKDIRALKSPGLREGE